MKSKKINKLIMKKNKYKMNKSYNYFIKKWKNIVMNMEK